MTIALTDQTSMGAGAELASNPSAARLPVEASARRCAKTECLGVGLSCPVQSSALSQKSQLDRRDSEGS